MSEKKNTLFNVGKKLRQIEKKCLFKKSLHRKFRMTQK